MSNRTVPAAAEGLPASTLTPAVPDAVAGPARIRALLAEGNAKQIDPATFDSPETDAKPSTFGRLSDLEPFIGDAVLAIRAACSGVSDRLSGQYEQEGSFISLTKREAEVVEFLLMQAVRLADEAQSEFYVALRASQ